MGSLYHDVPEEFICPLTKVMMKNPFIDPEGNSYEMDAIMAYVAIHKESPITKKALSAINLDKNLVLQQKIEAFRLIPQVALSENNLMLSPLKIKLLLKGMHLVCATFRA